MSPRVARVLLSSPLPGLDHPFDYAIPDRLSEQVGPGVRVKVPFGTRKRLLDGFVVAVDVQPEPGVSPIDIEKVVSPVPVLTEEVLALARAVADRQAGVASDVLRLAIPPRHAREERAWAQRGGRASFAAAPRRPEASAGAGSRSAVLVRSGGEVAHGRFHPAWAAWVVRLAVETAERGEQLLVVVPDQRDIVVVAEAAAALGPMLRLVRLDAGADAASRYGAFLDVLAGDADLILGNRQAVYAPATRLGGIVIWEDGDPSLAEAHAPYANARDVAMLRHAQTGVDLAFASHSRSTAVQRLVEMGWLDERVVGETSRLIPSGQIFGADDGRAGIPHPVWLMASDAIEKGGQVLVQVARRGYARVLLCAECGTAARCLRCGGPLGLKTDERSIPECRWCGQIDGAFRCPVCHSVRLRHAAPGVERTSRDIGRAFPKARIVTSTGDKPVARVPPGRSVVLATPGVEPLPDSGGYEVVILLDCEWMLGREGLLAVEDAMRSWMTAAALAAPGAGTVVAMGVEGRLARALSLWRPELFASDELSSRRAAHFPPAERVCAITGPVGATRRTLDLADAGPGVRVIGTVPLQPDHTDTAGERERTLLTLPYSRGGAFAASLRAAAAKAPQYFADWGIPRPSRSTSPIRIRFDDVESL